MNPLLPGWIRPAVGHVLHRRGSHECHAAAIRPRQLGCGRRRPHTPRRISHQSLASRLVDTQGKGPDRTQDARDIRGMILFGRPSPSTGNAGSSTAGP